MTPEPPKTGRVKVLSHGRFKCPKCGKRYDAPRTAGRCCMSEAQKAATDARAARIRRKHKKHKKRRRCSGCGKLFTVLSRHKCPAYGSDGIRKPTAETTTLGFAETIGELRTRTLKGPFVKGKVFSAQTEAIAALDKRITDVEDAVHRLYLDLYGKPSK